MATTAGRTARRKGRRGDKWSTANTIAACSIVVALVAVALSAWQARQTARSQRLSVRPYVVFGFDYQSGMARFTMDNRGVGPASLRWFEALVDGKPRGSWQEFLEALGVAEGTEFHQSNPVAGVMMQPSALAFSIPVVSVHTVAAKEVLIRAHPRANLRACYCSMYDECWIATLDRLDPRPVDDCTPVPRSVFGWAR